MLSPAMGKQSRRKRQPKRGQRPGSGKQDLKSVPPSSSGSLLLQRLRHSDPRTRQAALASLATTLFDPDRLVRTTTSVTTESKSSMIISTELLQAIRERVMDDDLECAQAATGCLNNYVAFSPIAPSLQECSAGWTIIFMGRLRQCCDMILQQLRSPANIPSQELTSAPQQLISWMALTVQCLQTLCLLVENNADAVERIEQHSPSETLHLLMDLLSMATRNWDVLVLNSSVEKDVEKSFMATWNTIGSYLDQDSSEQSTASGMLQAIALYSARALHSILDDNSDLLLPWLLSSSPQAKLCVQFLEEQCCASNVSQSNTKVMTQLHCAGCLVAIRQQVIRATLLLGRSQNHRKLQQHQQWVNVLHESVVVRVLPFLKLYLRYDALQCQQLLHQYTQAWQLYRRELADSQLEREVIRQVKQRHEPARLIARRHKSMKDEREKQQNEVMSTNENEMDVIKYEEVREEDDKTSNYRRDDMDGAQRVFHSSLLALQLALEITANLVPTSIEVEGDNDSAMEHDVEDTTVAPAAKDECSANLADFLLMQGFTELRIPDQVVSLLQQICSSIVSIDTATGDEASSHQLPIDSLEELDNLVSKCAACLGNCLAYLSSWQAPDNIWMTLRECITLMTPHSSNTEARFSSNTTGADGLWDTMAVASKSREDILQQQVRQPTDIDWLLGHLVSASPTNLYQQRDIIAILGAWCSVVSHSAELNYKVCGTLLAILDQTGFDEDSGLATETWRKMVLINEIFNAFIDIYGNDQHSQVFDTLDVVVHLQRGWPVFGRLIRSVAQRGGDQNDSEALEQWHATAMNVQQFITYMKKRR